MRRHSKKKKKSSVIEWLREQREKEYRESAVIRRRGAKAEKNELEREEGLNQEE